MPKRECLSLAFRSARNWRTRHGPHAMAHRRKISKTRIRDFVRRLAEYGCDDIDLFRREVHDALVKLQHALNNRAATLTEEAQGEFLIDEVYELDTVSRLADHFAIVSLYRVVEINTARMLSHEFGKAATKKASHIAKLTDFLKREKGVSLSSVPYYRAIDELRLLNNAIKHAGTVTKELADKYNRWREGEELSGLDRAYDRFRPKVPAYIFRLAQRMKLRYK
jgi:hypothetical protein